MKKLLAILFITATSACSEEQKPANTGLGIGLVSTAPNEAPAHRNIPDQRLIELVHNTEHINISAPEVKETLRKSREGASYSADTMNLFRAAVHRFYSTVSVKNRTLTSPLKSGAEIGVNEDIFQELQAGLSAVNNDLSGSNLAADGFTDSVLIRSIKEQLENFPD